jgi:hypothetical protein
VLRHYFPNRLLHYLNNDIIYSKGGVMTSKENLQKMLETRSHRSKNDPDYESDILTMLVEFFMYARTHAKFILKHRIHRNPKRKKFLNYEVEKTPIELMEDFISKKVSLEAYSIPENLMIIRKFYNSSSQLITFSTFYNAFKRLGDTLFTNKFPNITFESIAEILNSIHSKVTDIDIHSNHKTILDFYNLYRK